MGARPLRRTIQREIEDSLSERILFNELTAGQIVVVDTTGEGDSAEFTFRGEPKPVPGAGHPAGPDVAGGPPRSKHSRRKGRDPRRVHAAFRRTWAAVARGGRGRRDRGWSGGVRGRPAAAHRIPDGIEAPCTGSTVSAVQV